MPRRSSSPLAPPARVARTVVLAGLLAASVAAAGCGSDSSSAAGASGRSSADNQRDTARVKLQQCLRQAGVDLPAGGGGGGGGGGGTQVSDADREKLQAAMAGPCKALQTQAFGNVTDAQRQEFQDAFTKFAACMRQQGVDVPDQPAGGGGGPPAGGGNRLDRSDPKVEAAMTACQDKLPQGAGGGPGGGGPGGGGR